MSRQAASARTRKLTAALPAFVVVCGFTALAVWQLQRLAWKLNLIARVDGRVHAPPVPQIGPELVLGNQIARSSY